LSVFFNRKTLILSEDVRALANIESKDLRLLLSLLVFPINIFITRARNENSPQPQITELRSLFETQLPVK